MKDGLSIDQFWIGTSGFQIPPPKETGPLMVQAIKAFQSSVAVN